MIAYARAIQLLLALLRTPNESGALHVLVQRSSWLVVTRNLPIAKLPHLIGRDWLMVAKYLPKANLERKRV